MKGGGRVFLKGAFASEEDAGFIHFPMWRIGGGDDLARLLSLYVIRAVLLGSTVGRGWKSAGRQETQVPAGVGMSRKIELAFGRTT